VAGGLDGGFEGGQGGFVGGVLFVSAAAVISARENRRFHPLTKSRSD
jgi:hypothetical protein